MKKITQKQIAEFFSLSPSFLNELKRGKKSLSVRRAKELSEASGVPFEILALSDGEALYSALLSSYKNAVWRKK